MHVGHAPVEFLLGIHSPTHAMRSDPDDASSCLVTNVATCIIGTLYRCIRRSPTRLWSVVVIRSSVIHSPPWHPSRPLPSSTLQTGVRWWTWHLNESLKSSSILIQDRNMEGQFDSSAMSGTRAFPDGEGHVCLPSAQFATLLSYHGVRFVVRAWTFCSESCSSTATCGNFPFLLPRTRPIRVPLWGSPSGFVPPRD